MSKLSKNFTIFFGIVMSVAMVASLILPLLTSGIQQSQTIDQATAVPEPTVPPPIEDLSTISFDETYLHPTGLYTVAVPEGWVPSTNSNNANQAVATFNNSTLFSIVESSVIQPNNPVSTVEDVETFFSDSWLNESWQRYSTWDETLREIDGDRVVMDFNLTQGSNQYIARQYAWTDGDWIYSVRVVTLDNASDMLRYVLNKVAETIQPNKSFAGTPFDWEGYFDRQNLHLIRYPDSLVIEDTAPGAPTTFASDGVILRVEADATTIEDEAAAEAWLKAWRSGVEIVSIEPIEQDGSSGFSVAYTLSTPDGAQQSGLAVMLNGADDQVHIANMRVNEGGLDFNAQDAESGDYGDMVRALHTFSVWPQFASIVQ